MSLTISPAAQHDITRNALITPEDMGVFGAKLISCCLQDKQLFDQAAACVNFDNQLQKYNRQDFTDIADAVIFTSMLDFKRCWYEGNPWPAHRADWIKAVLPHLDFAFKQNPELPAALKIHCIHRIGTLPYPGPGEFDLICDGLIDYISGIRYHQLEKQLKHADPSRKRKAYEDLALTIRIPNAKVLIQDNEAIMDQIFAIQQPTKPFYTGVRQYDHYYGEKARGGDAWLAFGHPGGGKTNLACQTAGHTAARGKLVAYITTEVKVGTILQRCCSAESGIPYNVLKAMSGDRGHPQASAFYNWVNTVGKNITILDYREAGGRDYKEKFKRMMEAFYQKYGRVPDLMIWDWIGKALDSGFADPWQKREAYNGVAAMMVDKADEYDNVSLTLAQANKDSKNKTNLTEQDTADSRSLCDGMEGVIGITSLLDTTEKNTSTQECHKEFQFLVICKCREEQALRISVKRRFDLARFEST
jgi:hypothetical protein